jgi:arylsulfatase
MIELGVANPDWPLSPRHPEVPAWEDATHKEWQERRMEVYAAQVTCMDRNIGRIVKYLNDTDQFGDTLILYMHDNGGCHVEYGPKRTGSWTREFTTDGKHQPITPGNIPGLMPGPQTTFQSYGYGWANLSNTPFRLYKQHDHEGGTRSPLIVSWPSGIDRNRAGKLSHQLGHAIDIMPTLLDVAGAEIDRQQPMPFEGRSLRQSITSPEDHTDSKRTLFWQHARGKAIRDGDWKLVSQSKQPWELYELSKDGTELNDLVDQFPDRVAEMKRRFEKWESRTNLGADSNKQRKSKTKEENRKD